MRFDDVTTLLLTVLLSGEEPVPWDLQCKYLLASGLFTLWICALFSISPFASKPFPHHSPFIRMEVLTDMRKQSLASLPRWPLLHKESV